MTKIFAIKEEEKDRRQPIYMMHPSLPRECDEGVDFAEDLPRLLDRSLGGRDLVAADREFASAALKPILAAAADPPFELEQILQFKIT